MVRFGARGYGGGLAMWRAWLPMSGEAEADAHPQRTRGARAAAAYTQAAAAVAGRIEREAETLVATRSASDPALPIVYFAVRLDGNETIARLLSKKEVAAWLARPRQFCNSPMENISSG